MFDPAHTIKMKDFASSGEDSISRNSPQLNATHPSSSFQAIIGNKVEERNKHAQSLYDAGDFEGARREYKKLIFLSPQTAEYHVKYADTLAQANEIEEALIHYKRAQCMSNNIAINQKIYELMLKKGYSMIGNTQLGNYFEHTDINTPDLDLDGNSSLSAINPNLEGMDKTQGYFVRALAFLSENKKLKAIEELDKCTGHDSKNIYAFILKAKIYWSLNYVKNGHQEFWRAYEINSEHPEVKEFLKLVKEKIKKLYDQAIKYFWANDYEKSVYFINKGMEIEPKSVKLLLLRSLIYRKTNKYDQALKDIEKASLALEEFPELEDDIKRNLAVTYNEMGIQIMSKEDYKNAISLFDEALKFKSNDWGIIANKGDCYFKLKQYDMAKDQYNIAYSINPNNHSVNARIGLCCFKIGLEHYNAKKREKCLQCVDEALKWDPKNTEYLCFKGKLCLLLNDPKNSFQSYKAAAMASPNHKETLSFMSQFPMGTIKEEKIVFKKTLQTHTPRK